MTKRPLSEITGPERVILERAWHPRAKQVPFGVHDDQDDGTYHVTFRREDSDVAEALKERLGSAVTIDWGDPRRRTREP